MSVTNNPQTQAQKTAIIYLKSQNWQTMELVFEPVHQSLCYKISVLLVKDDKLLQTVF